MIAKYLLTMGLAVIPLAPMRCSTTGEVDYDVKLYVDSPIGKLGVEAHVEYSGSQPERTLEIHNDSAGPICGTVEFLDADGNVIDPPGTIALELAEGESAVVDVPAEATHHKLTETDCDSGDGARRGSPSPGRPFQMQLDTYSFRWGASTHDVTGARTSKEVQLEITTANGSLHDANLVADFLFAHGPSTPVPSWMMRRIAPEGIEVLLYVETAYASDGVHLMVADRDRFAEMGLVLNGTPYATLDDGSRSTSGAGWDVVSFFIPNHSFVYSWVPGATWTNTFRVTNVFHDKPDVEYRGDLTFASN